MSLYNNKYRIESNHLKEYDYSSEGDYSVTICLDKRHNFFGSIKDRKMFLSDAGKAATACWIELKSKFENIALGDFMFMPDHMHGIIRIGRKTGKTLHDMICVFKSKSTIAINKLQQKPGRKFWQEGFYDRIIRGEFEYFFASEYILNNPMVYEPGMEEKEWYELFEERKKLENL